VNAIEEVNNNVKLLTEMVVSHSQGAASGSSEDLMKVCCPSLLLAPSQTLVVLTCPLAALRSCTSAVSGCGPRFSDWPATQKTTMRP
jgi:hypothetical protein